MPAYAHLQPKLDTSITECSLRHFALRRGYPTCPRHLPRWYATWVICFTRVLCMVARFALTLPPSAYNTAGLASKTQRATHSSPERGVDTSLTIRPARHVQFPLGSSPGAPRRASATQRAYPTTRGHSPRWGTRRRGLPYLRALYKHPLLDTARRSTPSRRGVRSATAFKVWGKRLRPTRVYSHPLRSVSPRPHLLPLPEALLLNARAYLAPL